ncbi:MAG: exonuclease domain-containing protein [Sulfuricella sp.]|nr:exonuclease domain-containing protein [Sulfuricella sp.]
MTHDGIPLVFVDLETTGATAATDRITEIGIVEVSAEGVSEWSSLVNPGVPISSFIERLTGISDAMVAGAPTFAALAEEVLARLQGRLFVAHNARFDYGFLRSEFKRAGYDFRATVLCTVKLSRKLFPQHFKHSLDTLIERYGLSAAGRHRALADAQLIHQFWQRIHRDLPHETIAQAVTLLTAQPVVPPQLDAGLVEEMPQGHGAYVFYGEDDAPLFAGKSSNVRKRVLAHFAAPGDAALCAEIRRVEWIECAGPVGALLQEAALLRKLHPAHNRPARRGDEELCAWRLVEQAAGRFVPELVLAGEADFARDENLYGLFSSPKEARKRLQDLARAHHLCLSLLGLEALPPGAPCSAHEAGRCLGACVAKEDVSLHSARLMAALARLKTTPWPFPGAALLLEGEEGYAREAHVVDGWCYLGTARAEGEVEALLAGARPTFERDTYRILSKFAGRMQAVG